MSNSLKYTSFISTITLLLWTAFPIACLYPKETIITTTPNTPFIYFGSEATSFLWFSNGFHKISFDQTSQTTVFSVLPTYTDSASTIDMINIAMHSTAPIPLNDKENAYIIPCLKNGFQQHWYSVLDNDELIRSSTLISNSNQWCDTFHISPISFFLTTIDKSTSPVTWHIYEITNPDWGEKDNIITGITLTSPDSFQCDYVTNWISIFCICYSNSAMKYQIYAFEPKTFSLINIGSINDYIETTKTTTISNCLLRNLQYGSHLVLIICWLSGSMTIDYIDYSNGTTHGLEISNIVPSIIGTASSWYLYEINTEHCLITRTTNSYLQIMILNLPEKVIINSFSNYKNINSYNNNILLFNASTSDLYYRVINIESNGTYSFILYHDIYIPQCHKNELLFPFSGNPVVEHIITLSDLIISGDGRFGSYSIIFINLKYNTTEMNILDDTSTAVETSNLPQTLKKYTTVKPVFERINTSGIVQYSIENARYDNSHIPYNSWLCTTKIRSICHTYCNSCSVISEDDSNQECNECLPGFYFISNTKNCFHNPEGYYLDQTDLEYHQCHSNCRTCETSGLDINNNCTSCKTGFVQLSQYTHNIIDDTNCVEYCDKDQYSWYFLNKSNRSSFKCYISLSCPGSHWWRNIATGECTEACETNDCVLGIPSDKDEAFVMVTNNVLEIYNYSYDIKSDSYIITLDSSKNQITRSTFSTIQLLGCEDKLKKVYNIRDDESILILIMDVKAEKIINEIEYWIFGRDGMRLDWSYCEGETITISTPINIQYTNYTTDELRKLMSVGVDIFNANAPFFNDYCSNFTADNGADVSIKDRREYYFQNQTWCPKGCIYDGVDYESWNANCTCKLNGDGGFNFDLMINNYYSEGITATNVKIINCTRVWFSAQTFKHFGFYIILTLTMAQFVCFVFAFITNNLFMYYNPIIKKVIVQKAKPSKQIKNKPIPPPRNGSHNDNEINNRKSKKKVTINDLSIKEQKRNQLDNIDYEEMDNNLTLNKTPRNNYNHSSLNTWEALENPNHQNSQNNKLPINLSKEIELFIECDNDKTIVTFTTWTMWWNWGEWIKSHHPIYWTFFLEEPKLNKWLRYSTLFMHLNINFVINALLYNDNYISDNYHNNNKFDFLNELPKIINSSWICILWYAFFSSFVTVYSFEQREINEINEDQTKRNSIISKAKCIVFWFFMFMILFSLFLFYYFLAFSGVYSNTRDHLLICGCIGIGLIMVIPLILSTIMYFSFIWFAKFKVK